MSTLDAGAKERINHSSHPLAREVWELMRANYRKAGELFRRGSPGKKYDTDALKGISVATLQTVNNIFIGALYTVITVGGLTDTQKSYREYMAKHNRALVSADKSA